MSTDKRAAKYYQVFDKDCYCHPSTGVEPCYSTMTNEEFWDGVVSVHGVVGNNISNLPLEQFFDRNHYSLDEIRSWHDVCQFMSHYDYDFLYFFDESENFHHWYLPAYYEGDFFSYQCHGKPYSDKPYFIEMDEDPHCLIQEFYSHDKKTAHRIDGPAIIKHYDKSLVYCINGHKLSEGEFVQWREWYDSSEENRNLPWDWGLYLMDVDMNAKLVTIYDDH